MNVDVAAALLLIAVPIAFNLAFLELGRTFDYPGILREPADVVLQRFNSGGTPLLLRWNALLLSALAMLPLVAVLGVALEATAALTATTIVVGAGAAIVQVLGLVRWPFVVGELARRHVAARGPGNESTRQSIELVFTTFHRLMGVGIGEHLGYLLTGLWTVLVAASVVTSGVMAPWLGWIGVPIGVALLVGSFEFVGSNEDAGWSVAGAIVPVAYITWSLWLVALGVALLIP